MKAKAYFIITFSLFILVAAAFSPSTPKTLELPKASANLTEHLDRVEVQPAEIAKGKVELTQNQVIERKPIATAPIPKLKANPKPIVKQPVVVNCSDGSFNTQFLCLLNEYRKSQKLNAVSYDSALTTTAAVHSAWMNANANLSHTGQDGSRFFERCQQQQTTCDSENLAMGYTTAQKLFDAWKNSSGHNANMLGSHTKIGLALVGKYSTLVLR